MSLEFLFLRHILFIDTLRTKVHEITWNSISVSRDQGTRAAKINFVPIFKPALNKKKAN